MARRPARARSRGARTSAGRKKQAGGLPWCTRTLKPWKAGGPLLCTATRSPSRLRPFQPRAPNPARSLKAHRRTRASRTCPPKRRRMSSQIRHCRGTRARCTWLSAMGRRQPRPFRQALPRRRAYTSRFRPKRSSRPRRHPLPRQARKFRTRRPQPRTGQPVRAKPRQKPPPARFQAAKAQRPSRVLAVRMALGRWCRRTWRGGSRRKGMVRCWWA